MLPTFDFSGDEDHPLAILGRLNTHSAPLDQAAVAEGVTSLQVVGLL